MTSKLRHVTIARDDYRYEAFPDVCRLRGDGLLCAYRESDYHGASTSRLVLIESRDRGRTWTNQRQIDVTLSIREDRSVWNNPRLVRLADGRIVATLDIHFLEDGGVRGIGSLYCHQTWLSFSEDDGKTWTERHLTAVEGIGPSRVVPRTENHWLMANTHSLGRFPDATRVEVVHSYDGGLTWPISALGAEQEGFQHEEPALVDLPDGRVLMVMREDQHTNRPSHYVISEDEGYVWSTPRQGPFYGDRPTGGVLQSGRLLFTYRNVEPAPGETTMKEGRNPGTWAWLGDMAGLTGSGGESRFLELERDPCGRFGDYGYSGWVQFDDGEIFCAYHHRDEAPKSYIRGCWFREDDFPEQ